MMIFDRLAATVAPHICIGCGIEGSVLCEMCLQNAGEPPVSRCSGCKVLTKEYRTCRACRSWLDVYAVYVATEYDGLYEQLLHNYKFKLKRQAVIPISTIMSGLPITLPAHVVSTQVPTAPSRIRFRGFDHAALLAKTLQPMIDESGSSKLIYIDVLNRKSNIRQLGASRSQRIKQMQNEFQIKAGLDLSGCTVLLMDDVMTTGASLAAAAKVLKKAGVSRVYAIVFAQKL